MPEKQRLLQKQSGEGVVPLAVEDMSQDLHKGALSAMEEDDSIMAEIIPDRTIEYEPGTFWSPLLKIYTSRYLVLTLVSCEANISLLL